MDRSTLLVMLQYGLNAAWILVPLIPAALIYKIFPKTRVTASGPFQGLQLKLGGAFAAYIVLLLITIPFLQMQNENFKFLFATTWTIRGTIEVVDSDNNKIDINEHQAEITLDNPTPINIRSNGAFTIKVPVIENQLPEVHIKYIDYGEESLPAFEYVESIMKYSGPKEYEDKYFINEKEKTIYINKPIIISKSCEGSSC